jgi:thiol-disulfide isomerase/thioredoxin
MRISLMIALFVGLASASSSAYFPKAQSGQSAEGASEAAAAKEELKPMLQLKLQDLKGKKFDPDALKGNILVLDFWATWCGPCIAEVPQFNELQKKYEDKGVKVVGVAMASGAVDEIRPFTDRFNMKYSILVGDDDQQYDLNIIAFPTTFLVTKDWKIYGVYIGAGPSKTRQIESGIKKLLGS